MALINCAPHPRPFLHFLMGMFVALDTVTGFSLENALRQISLPAEVEAVLLGTESPLSPFHAIYPLVQAKPDAWEVVGAAASALQVGGEDRDTYLEV